MRVKIKINTKVGWPSTISRALLCRLKILRQYFRRVLRVFCAWVCLAPVPQPAWQDLLTDITRECTDAQMQQ